MRKCRHKDCRKRLPKLAECETAHQEAGYCGPDCALEYRKANAKRLKEKADRERQKQRRRQKRDFYRNDVKTRREAAVYWFNRFIRLRDSGTGCISCGTTNPDIKYDAGHYVAAGTCTALRFDEQNVNLQCSVNCNQHLSGNRAAYRDGLIRKYGEATVDRLEGPQPTIKTTADYYYEIEQKYKAKCKTLEGEQLCLAKVSNQ